MKHKNRKNIRSVLLHLLTWSVLNSNAMNNGFVLNLNAMDRVRDGYGAAAQSPATSSRSMSSMLTDHAETRLLSHRSYVEDDTLLLRH